MEEYGVETTRVRVSGLKSPADVQALTARLESLAGVEAVFLEGGELAVKHYPQVASVFAIRQEVSRMGHAAAESGGKRRPVGRFLDRMIESNRKTFGNQTPDCCTLNRRQQL